MSDAPRARAGRPPVTSRADVLAAARRLIDLHGWERLSIRKLAAEIGIAPTTLYHHVRDKEDLLFLLINEYGEQIAYPVLPDDPRERVVAAAMAIHDALAAWPWAAEVLTTDGFIGRVGGSALGMVEAIVGGAIEHGCSPDQAVHVFRGIWYYTVGEILVRSHPPQPPRPELFGGRLDPAELPHLAGIGERWVDLAARDTYENGLRAFVDGLLR